MEATTAKWARALATSHTATIRCEVWDRGEKIVPSLPLLSGSVTDKWVSGTRRNIEITVPPLPQWRELLATPLIELRPYRGINYGYGAPEVLPLGQFPVLYDADNADPKQPLQITADDKWQTILADDFYGPTVSGTGLIRDEIVKLVQQTTLGPVTVTATSTAAMTLRLYSDSRHAAIMDLCTAIGAEIFVSRRGQVILRDRRASVAPSATIRGGEQGSLVTLQAERDWGQVYNVVVVRPTATNVAFTPVIVSITDTSDPAHPSRIGRRVYRYDTSLVADPAQAKKAGLEMLRKLSAPQRSLSLSCVPNAAIDASDTIAAIWPSDLYETAQVDQIAHPLVPETAQPITTVLSRAETP